MASVTEHGAGGSRAISRRRFLIAVVVTGGVAAVGCAGPAGAPAPTAPAPTTAPAVATRPAAAEATKPAAAGEAPKPAAPPATAAAAASGETPVPGGAFRMAFAGAPDSLDPQKTTKAEGFPISGHLCDNLTQITPDGKLAPMLATKWTPEKNAQEWVLELREGVKFHHGKEFGADDVVASFNRLQDAKNAFSNRNQAGPITEVRVEAKNRVRLVLEFPFAELPIALAHPGGRMLPADRLDRIEAEPVGTGPFKLKDYQPGAQTVLARNPDYWMKGKPYVDELRLVTIKEPTAQMAALQSGAIDAIYETTSELHVQLDKVPGVVPILKESPAFQAMIMTTTMEPFTRPEVRQAFKLLLDRDGLVKTLLLGQGVVGNDYPVARFSEFWVEKPQVKRDLEQAKALLAKAGASNLSLDLWTSSERPPSQKLSVVFKEAAQAAGVSVEVHDVPQAVSAAEVTRKKAFYTAHFLGKPTLYGLIYASFHSKGGLNYALGPLDPKLDGLIEQMIAETDGAKRKALLAQILDLNAQVGYMLIPYFMGYTSAQSSKVRGYQPGPYRDVDVRDTWLKTS